MINDENLPTSETGLRRIKTVFHTFDEIWVPPSRKTPILGKISSPPVPSTKSWSKGVNIGESRFLLEFGR